MIPDGGVPLLPEFPGMGKTRFGSIGDCPCLDVMMMVVESRRPWCLSAPPSARSPHPQTRSLLAFWVWEYPGHPHSRRSLRRS